MALRQVVCRHCGHVEIDHGRAAPHALRALKGRGKRGYQLTVLQCTQTRGFAAEYCSSQRQQGGGGIPQRQMS